MEVAQSRDLDVVIVSHGDGAWLDACLGSLEAHRGECAVSIVIVENGPESATLPDSATGAPDVRVVRAANRGFAAANNLGIRLTSSPYVLFLNPDTEVADGSLLDLIATLEDTPTVGMLAVKQVGPNGSLLPSIRRFPRPLRTLAQALVPERWPWLGPKVSERVLDERRYRRSGDCDWTTGAVMLIRREALRSAGDFDERFFLFSEETDIARRIKQAGWRNVYTPALTVVHHAGKAGVDPRREAQMAYARWQYACKHAYGVHRTGFWLGLLLGHVGRIAILSRRGPTTSSSCEASLAALKVLLGLAAPPYRADATVSQRLDPFGSASPPQ